jgi:hypothetical protein
VAKWEGAMMATRGAAARAAHRAAEEVSRGAVARVLAVAEEAIVVGATVAGSAATRVASQVSEIWVRD